MRGGDITTATERRFKGSAAAAAAARRQATKVMMNIDNIDHLPDVVLVEILCRLPSYKFVSQCKCVSQRWSTLVSDPCFIGRFLCLKSDHKQAPIVRTLINSKGEEFLSRMSSSSKPLTHLFERLMFLQGLKEEPVVVATYNDLVLCCAGKYHQRYYYICNPFTQQYVALPSIPRCQDKIEPLGEGFICDLPYYDYKKDNREGDIIQLNTEYRCKVVRLIRTLDSLSSSQFKVQIFSSETGEWRESIVSSPQEVELFRIPCRPCIANADNGMLYWMCPDDFLLGLDPFMINNKNSTSLSSTTSGSSTDGVEIMDQSYQCRFIDLTDEIEYVNNGYILLKCLGVYGGCIRFFDYNDASDTLFLWDLNEEERLRGARNLCLKNERRYALDENMIPRSEEVMFLVLGLDPNNEDILYLCLDRGCLDREIIMCNIRTTEWSKMAGMTTNGYDFYPLGLPRWPTPVPILQHAQRNHGQPTRYP